MAQLPASPLVNMKGEAPPPAAATELIPLKAAPGKSPIMGGVDPRLVTILTTAARDFPYEVVVRSAARPGDSRLHGRNIAIDINIIDPKTGKAFPDYQNAQSFRVYEQFAQVVRTTQQQLYPSLNDALRWGGYFGSDAAKLKATGKDKYGAVDLMHFDLGGLRGAGMLGGSWANGLTPAQRALYPGAVSIGMADIDMQRLAQLGYTGPGAVEAYQRDRGLKVDGIIGPQTTKAIQTDILAPKPPAGIPGGLRAPFSDRAMLAPEVMGVGRTYPSGVPTPPARPGTATVAPAPAPKAGIPTPRARPELVTASGYVIGKGKSVTKNASPEVIKDIQRYLNSRGITDDKGNPIKVDGKLGARTKEAIKNYQESAGLRADGVVGPRTMTAMLQEQRMAEREGLIAQAEALTRNKDDLVSLTALATAAGIDPATGTIATTPGSVAADIGAAIAGAPMPSNLRNPYGLPDPLADRGTELGRKAEIINVRARQEAARLLDAAIGGTAQTTQPPRGAVFDPDYLQAVNALTLDHTAPLDQARSYLGGDSRELLSEDGDLLYSATQAYALQAREQQIAAVEARNEPLNVTFHNTPINNAGSYFGASDFGTSGGFQQGSQDVGEFGSGTEGSQGPTNTEENTQGGGSGGHSGGSGGTSGGGQQGEQGVDDGERR